MTASKPVLLILSFFSMLIIACGPSIELDVDTLSEITVTIGDCAGSTEYMIEVDFDYNTDADSFYLSTRNNVLVGKYSLRNLPISIYNFELSGEETEYIRACIVGISSCSETEWSPPECNTVCQVENSECLPNYFIVNGSTWYKYGHDNNGRLNRIRRYFNQFRFDQDQWEAEIFFEYNGSDQFSKSSFYIDGGLSSDANYFYTNGKLDSIITEDQAGDDYRFLLEYEEGTSCGPDRTHYFSPYNSIHKDFVYDQNCGYTLTEVDSMNETVTHSVELEFDNQANHWPHRFIFIHSNTHDYVYPYSNNITSKIIRDMDGNVIQSYASEYIYYANGFPEKEIRTSGSGGVSTIEFYYK
jgi:hypothetical protein